MKQSLKRLEAAARSLAPRGRVQRFESHGLSILLDQQLPKTLSPDLVEVASIVASREAIIVRMQKRVVVAELGTCRSAFARRMPALADLERLHLIDVD